MTKRRSVVLIVVVAALAAFFVVTRVLGWFEPERVVARHATRTAWNSGDGRAASTLHDRDHGSPES